MTRPLPTLREIEAAYETEGSEPGTSNWWSCPLAVTLRSAGVEADGLTLKGAARRTYGNARVDGFITGYDGMPWAFLFEPEYWLWPFRYLAAFRYGRRVRRALIGGDK